MRAPMADTKIPHGLTDEQVLFLGDIFPTGWQAAVNCDIQPDDTVAIWGAGPVGQMAIRAVVLLGARQVVVIDRVSVRPFWWCFTFHPTRPVPCTVFSRR